MPSSRPAASRSHLQRALDRLTSTMRRIAARRAPRAAPLAGLLILATASSAIAQANVAISPKTQTGSYALGVDHEAYFTVTNTGNASGSFSISTVCSGALQCSANAQSRTLIAGQTWSVTVGYYANATGTGTLTLTASTTGASDQAVATIQVFPPGVTVSPTTTNVTHPANTVRTGTFTVTNPAAGAIYYTTGVTCSGALTNCSVSPAGFLVASGAQQTVTATYTTGAAGTFGAFAFTAYTTGANATGTINVTSLRSNSVTVAPKGTTVSQPAWTLPTQSFTITNTRNSSANYTVVKSCGGTHVTCSSAGQGGTSTVTVAAGATATLGFTYQTHGPPFGTGWVRVKATAGNNVDSATVNVWVQEPKVAVSPATASASHPAGSAQTRVFTIQNSGEATSTYTNTVACVNLTSCSVSPASVTIPSRGSANVTASYTVGAAGSSGNLTVTAATPGVSATGRLDVTATSLVTVGPKNDTNTVNPATSRTINFFVKNNGSATTTFAVTASCTDPALCSPFSGSVTLAGGAQQTVPITYTTGPNETGANIYGYVKFKAAAGAAADSVLYTVKVTPPPPVVTVTPKNATRTLPVSTAGNTFPFTVANPSTNPTSMEWNVTATCTGSVTCSYANIHPLAGGQQLAIPITFATTGTPGTGTIKLKAIEAGISDSAIVTVTVVAPTGTVTINPSTTTKPPATTQTADFTLANPGAATSTYTLSATCTGALVGCSVPPPTSVTLGSGASVVVPVSYTTGAQNTTGSVILTATSGSFTALDTLDVTARATVAVMVSPKGQVATVLPNALDTATFVVQNTGDVTTDFAVAGTCSGATTCNASNQTLTLAPSETRPVDVIYQALTNTSGADVPGMVWLVARSGTVADSADLAVSVKSIALAVGPIGQVISVNSNVLDTATFTVTNSGNATATVTLNGTCSGGASCGVFNPTITVAAGQSLPVDVPYQSAANTTGAILSGTVKLVAASGGAADSSSYSIQISSPTTTTIFVTPKDRRQTFVSQTFGNTIDFFVNNIGSPNTVTIDGTCSGAVRCSPYSRSVSLNQGQQWIVTITYDTDANTTGADIFGTLKVRAFGGGAGNADSSELIVTVQSAAPPQISIGPKGQAITAQPNRINDTATFEVFNQSAGTVPVTVTGSCTGAATCPPYSSTFNVGPSARQPVKVPYGTAANTTSGTLPGLVSVVATSGAARDTASLAVTVTRPGIAVRVSPKDVSVSRIPDGWDDYYTMFDVQNTGTDTTTFTITVTCGGAVSCGGRLSSIRLAPGEVRRQYSGSYYANSVGPSGYLQYKAESGGIADSGRLSITIDPVPTSAVFVTPKYSGVTLSATTTSETRTFYVQSNAVSTSAPATYTLEALCSGGLSCGAPSRTQLTLAGGQIDSVSVTYARNGSSPFGQVWVKATGPGGVSDKGHLNVTLSTGNGVIVGPKNTTWTNYGGDPQPNYFNQFTVYNPAPAGSPAIAFSLTCTSVGDATCTIYQTAAYLAGGQSSRIDVYWATKPNTSDTVTTGTVLLTATGPNGETDTGTETIYVLPTPPTDVFVKSWALGQDGSVARDACLDEPIGKGASYECGDLRVEYSLPAISTLNKARQPSLLFLSSHANGSAEISADVRIQGEIHPTQIVATLRVDGQPLQTFTMPWNQYIAASEPRRITIPVDGRTMTTGVYHYTLDVSETYNGATATGSDTGSVTIVNRAASQFGKGWWLEGLEELRMTVNPANPSVPGMLWVGGDGSTRVYTLVATDTYTVKRPLNRPDTLIRVGAVFRRLLPNGAYTEFDASGNHVATVSSVGHRTTFDWTGGPLQGIQLPTASGGQTPRYTFSYVYPAGLPVRLKEVHLSGTGSIDQPVFVSVDGAGWVEKIRYLDSTSAETAVTRFAPDANGHLDKLYDALDNPTQFSWLQGKLITARTWVTPRSNDIVIGFQPAELLGRGIPNTFANTPSHALDAATMIFRPVATNDPYDFDSYWLNRFGGVDSVLTKPDGVWMWTRILRGDPRFPLLATTVVERSGFTRRTIFNARGLPDTVIAVRPLAPDTLADAVTKYTWHPKWNLPATVTAPTGEVTTFTYDPVMPVRRSQSDGRSTTTFGYDATLGNLEWTRLWRGIVDSVARDPIGRIVARYTPINATLRRRDSTVYYPSGRIQAEISNAPAVGTTPAENITLAHTYTKTGLPRTLQRAWSNDPRVVNVLPPLAKPPLTTTWEYDEAGRKVSEIAPDGKKDTTRFDAAGNAIAYSPRPRQQFADTINMRYDYDNRLERRIVPGVTYAADTMGIPSDFAVRDYYLPFHPDAFDPAKKPLSFFTQKYPQYPTDATGSYKTPFDTTTYTYDDYTDALLSATNVDGRVERTYYPNGQLRTEIQQIPTKDRRNRTLHTYLLGYRYDLSGRRTALIHPSQLATGAARDRTSWSYDAVTGELQSVTDVQGNRVSYQYHPDGSLHKLFRGDASGVSDWNDYDPDGRLLISYVFNSGNSPYKWQVLGPTSTLRLESYEFDPRDKLTKVSSSSGFRNVRTLEYSGLGYLTKGNFFTQTPLRDATIHHHLGESYSLDGLGHTLSLRNTGSDTVFMNGQIDRLSFDNTDDEHVYDAMGRHVETRHPSTTKKDTIVYDGAGNRERMRQKQLAQNDIDRLRDERWSYYGADGKQRADDHRTMANRNVLYTSVFQEYRYDPMGRRNWVTTKKWCQGNYDANPLCRLSSVKRTIWDGSAELYEIQMPDTTLGGIDARENDADTLPRMVPVVDSGGVVSEQYKVLIDPNVLYGRVAYAYGLGVDQPASVTRFGYVSSMDRYRGGSWDGSLTGSDSLRPAIYSTAVRHPVFGVMPIWNYQGRAELGVFSDGGATSCKPQGTILNCVDIFWPRTMNAYRRELGVRTRSSWHGSLIEDKQDASGLLYRRNRMYDPQTAKFTQEDPLGLAGGLNLYGFAGGDPANYSDPLGLFPIPLIVVGAVALFEAASTAYDAYQVKKAMSDPNASRFDKAAAVGGLVVGLKTPGPGSLYTKGARRAAEAVHFHHAWPKYLGGAHQQLLEVLPKNLHSAYHSGLDKILPRQAGGAFYEDLSAAELRKVHRDFETYTKAFDRAHGTHLWEAAVREGFRR